MNTLPIPADSIDGVYCNALPHEADTLTAQELLTLKALPGLPSWIDYVAQMRKAAGQPAAQVSLTDLNKLLPYMVSYYPTPEGGCICTTRRVVVGRKAEKGHAAIPARKLDPAHCFEGSTPASALLAMIATRFNNGEMRYNGAGSMVVLKAVGA